MKYTLLYGTTLFKRYGSHWSYGYTRQDAVYEDEALEQDQAIKKH